MKSLHFFEHGPIENLRYGDVEDPNCAPREVIVKVGAAAMNHLDLWILRGWPGLSLAKPHIGGADISGQIEQVGAEVSSWKTGDRVVVSPGYLTDGLEDRWTKRGEDSLSPRYRIFGEGRWGGFAEYVSVPESALIRLPNEIDFAQAAAVPLVAVTAWRMLKIRAQLQAGQSVLIVGAGGGLNSFAILLAKFFGAKVIALTSNSSKMEQASRLGADHVVNYETTPSWSKEVKNLTDGQGVDVVVDNVGQKTITQSILSTARGGRIVTVGNTSGPILEFDNRLLFTKQISLLGSTMGSKQDFELVMQEFFRGRLKAVVHCVLPLKPEANFSSGHRAYQLLERGEQFGKVVLTP